MSNNEGFIRVRRYTYAEMIGFAEYYFINRREYAPENAIRHFLNMSDGNAENDVGRKIANVIETAVAEYYELPIQQVRSKRRFAELIRARQVIAYWATQHATQNNVAQATEGNRNNVQYSKSKCMELMETESLLKLEVEKIGKIIDPLIKNIMRDEKAKHNDSLTNNSQDEKTESIEQGVESESPDVSRVNAVD